MHTDTEFMQIAVGFSNKILTFADDIHIYNSNIIQTQIWDCYKTNWPSTPCQTKLRLRAFTPISVKSKANKEQKLPWADTTC